MDMKQFKLDVMKFYSTMNIPEDFDFRIDMYQNSLKQTMLCLVKEVQSEKLLNQIPVSFSIDVKIPVNWFQHLKLDLNRKFGWRLNVKLRTKVFSQDKVIEVNTYLKYPQLRNGFGEGVKTVVGYEIKDRAIDTFPHKEESK